MGELIRLGLPDFQVNPREGSNLRVGKINLAFEELEQNLLDTAFRAVLPVDRSNPSVGGVGSTDQKILQVLSRHLSQEEIDSYSIRDWRERLLPSSMSIINIAPNFSLILPQKGKGIGARPISAMTAFDLQVMQIDRDQQSALKPIMRAAKKSVGEMEVLFPVTGAQLVFTLDDIFGNPHWQDGINLKQLIKEGKVHGSIYYLVLPFFKRYTSSPFMKEIPRKFGFFLMAEREWDQESLEAVKQYHIDWELHTGKGILQTIRNMMNVYSAGGPGSGRRS